VVVVANRRNLPSELFRGLENRGARGHPDGVAVDGKCHISHKLSSLEIVLVIV
jgi:hypothetical protein